MLTAASVLVMPMLLYTGVACRLSEWPMSRAKCIGSMAIDGFQKKEAQIIFQHQQGTINGFHKKGVKIIFQDVQVSFLTEIYTNVRRNSLEEAVKLCLASGMQGIVSDAHAMSRTKTIIF